MNETTTARCSAAHTDDPTPCQGDQHAVRIIDAKGYDAEGCEHHGARLLASLDGARVYPGNVSGAATRVLAAADTIRPFCWYEDAPRTEPSQLSHSENRTR